MTATAHAAPPAHGPPDGAPWRRERLRRLGIPLMARLAVQEIAGRRRSALAAAAFGLLCGVGLARAFDPVVGHGAWPVAAIALLAVAASLADATDPARRDDAALLVRLGCPPIVVWLAGWAAATAMVGLPAAVGAEVADLAGASTSGGRGAWTGALFFAGLGAATTAGARLPVPATLSRSGVRTRRLARTVLGLLAIITGAAIPGLSTTGGDLDLALPFGILLVIAGLALLAPAIVDGTSALAVRSPWAVARVAANSLRQQRRGLTIAIAAVATVVAVFLVQTVVGQGLGEREQARVDAIAALGTATAGGGPDVLIVDPQTSDRAEYWLTEGGGSPPDLAALAEAAGPGAQTVPVDRLQTEVLPVGERYGELDGPLGFSSTSPAGSTARATPELLRALGLDPALADADLALVLDDRVLADREVHLVGPPTSPPTNRRGTGVRVDAVDVRPGEVWTDLPAVLLPAPLIEDLQDASVGASGGESSPSAAVIRFPHEPTSTQWDAVARAAGSSPVGGAETGALDGVGRTDQIGSIGVRTPAEARTVGAALGGLALVALIVALGSLRLAVRPDDVLLIDLGARRRTLVGLAAVRAGTIALGAVAAGAVIGLTATAFGLWRYDHHGRFTSEVVLAPIGWHVPLQTWIGIAAVPLAAALLGALLERLWPAGQGGRRPIER